MGDTFVPLLRSIRQRYRPIYGTLIAGTVVTLLFLTLLQGLPIFSKAELSAYDLKFNLRGPRPITSQIAVVGLDQQSIDILSDGRYPIPRCWMGKAITFLHNAGARAIGLDFLFISPSSYGPKDDACLSNAIRKAGNVVVGQQLNGAQSSLQLQGSSSLEAPIPPVASHVAAAGLVNVTPDVDG